MMHINITSFIFWLLNSAFTVFCSCGIFLHLFDCTSLKDLQKFCKEYCNWFIAILFQAKVPETLFWIVHFTLYLDVISKYIRLLYIRKGDWYVSSITLIKQNTFLYIKMQDEFFFWIRAHSSFAWFFWIASLRRCYCILNYIFAQWCFAKYIYHLLSSNYGVTCGSFN